MLRIFKAGTHTSRAGTVKTYTEDDLERMANTYNENLSDPDNARQSPLCLGHPETDSPAYGWVDKLKREGKYLVAEVSNVKNEFVEAVKEGKYRFKSAAFYPETGLLRHVGFLGARQPAIAGLGPIEFADGDEYEEYEDVMSSWEVSWRFTRLADIMQGLREWIIESHDIATADTIIPSWEIDGLRPPPKSDPEYTEQNPKSTEDDDMELKQQLDKLQTEFSEVQSERNELKSKTEAQEAKITAQATEIANLQKQMTEFSQKATKAEAEQFCDALIKEGKMLPTERDYFVNDLVAKSKATGEFAEGESPVEQVKAMLNARTKHKLFDTTATPDRAKEKTGTHEYADNFNASEESEELDNRVRAIMKEKGITEYSEALELATQEM